MTGRRLSTLSPPGFDDAFAHTQRGPVHYVAGGSGPPLFLIHGGYGSWTHWIANLTALSRQYTVFALDMPGFGRSCDAAPNAMLDEVAFSVWEAIAVMRATLPAAMQSRAISIAAFSFGTVVAATMARMRPGAVRMLLLINPPGLGEVSQEVKEIQARASATARADGLRAGLNINLCELMLCQPARIDSHALDLLEECVRNTRFVSRSLSRASRLLPLLEDLKMPVHVLLGERDPHQRHELTLRQSRLEETLGTSHVHIFPDAAHWLQYDRPECFNRLASEWLAAV